MLIDMQIIKTFNNTIFVKKIQKYECGGLLKFKIYILFYETISWFENLLLGT
jgi:hypothetical protein